MLETQSGPWLHVTDTHSGSWLAVFNKQSDPWLAVFDTQAGKHGGHEAIPGLSSSQHGQPLLS